MRSKVGLVTGASAGIGFFTALGLAERGFEVIITGRDAERGARAEAELRRRSGHDGVHFVRVDHASLAQNRALGRFVADRWARLDVLVNNAGGISHAKTAGPALAASAPDYDPTLVLNFLGPYALTDALLSTLLRSERARIVNVTSSAYALWKTNPFRDGEGAIDVPLRAYARAKLLNLMWTFALARHVAGSGVVVNATNPGTAWTPGVERLTPEVVPHWRLLWPVLRWFQRRAPAERAARSSILLAADARFADVSGLYVESDCKPHRASVLARDFRHQEGAMSLGLRLVARAATHATEQRAAG
jgi:NAD(P)-dependent dehydrogenase (short-subunit alcohol dehydrogenase family)